MCCMYVMKNEKCAKYAIDKKKIFLFSKGFIYLKCDFKQFFF